MRIRRELIGGLTAVLMLAAAAGCGGAKPAAKQGAAAQGAAPPAVSQGAETQGASTPGAAPAQPATGPATQPSGNDATANPPATQAPAPATTEPAAPAVTAPSAPTANQPTAPTVQPQGPGPGAASPANPGAVPANPTQPAITTPPPPGQALPFTTLQKGAYSGFTQRTATLVTDSAAWQTTWGQLSARQVPQSQAPAVDFSSQSVLVVALGEQRTGGYSVTVTGATLENGKLKVSVNVTTPKPGAIVTQALTQPFHMVRLPKLPAGTTVEVDW